MNAHKILIVNDDNSAARRLLYHLKQAGDEGRVIHKSETALATIRAEKPDLVVLMIRLSDWDGLDITQAIRRDPRLSDIPIIIVSDDGTDENIATGLDARADDYLTWPFDQRELLARMKAVLRRSYPERSQTH